MRGQLSLWNDLDGQRLRAGDLERYALVIFQDENYNQVKSAGLHFGQFMQEMYQTFGITPETIVVLSVEKMNVVGIDEEYAKAMALFGGV